MPCIIVLLKSHSDIRRSELSKWSPLVWISIGTRLVCEFEKRGVLLSVSLDYGKGFKEGFYAIQVSEVNCCEGVIPEPFPGMKSEKLGRLSNVSLV